MSGTPATMPVRRIVPTGMDANNRSKMHKNSTPRYARGIRAPERTTILACGFLDVDTKSRDTDNQLRSHC